MAQYPCDGCGQRYRGKQNTIYPAMLSGAIEVREKVRLCDSCCEGALHLTQLVHDSSAQRDYAECGLCGGPATISLFVTSYTGAGGYEREDAAGRLCGKCASTRVGPQLYGGLRPLAPLDTALLRSDMAAG